MEKLIDYIEERIEEIEESYDFYLNKLDQTYDESEQRMFENRLRELRIEKNTLKDVMEKMDENKNKDLASD